MPLVYEMQRKLSRDLLTILHLDFCYAYLDDILIASNTKEEHTKHLEKVFTRLDTYSIQLNSAKCIL